MFLGTIKSEIQIAYPADLVISRLLPYVVCLSLILDNNVLVVGIRDLSVDIKLESIYHGFHHKPLIGRLGLWCLGFWYSAGRTTQLLFFLESIQSRVDEHLHLKVQRIAVGHACLILPSQRSCTDGIN